jgi:hypothetical protein
MPSTQKWLQKSKSFEILTSSLRLLYVYQCLVGEGLR